MGHIFPWASRQWLCPEEEALVDMLRTRINKHPNTKLSSFIRKSRPAWNGSASSPKENEANVAARLYYKRRAGVIFDIDDFVEGRRKNNIQEEIYNH